MKEELAAAALDLALTGRFSHPAPEIVLSGLGPEAAGAKPAGTDRTIHGLVGHLVYWQDVTLKWLRGEDPGDVTDGEASWRAGPRQESPGAWEALVRRFADGLAEARSAAAAGNLEAPVPGVPDGTRLSVLHVLATHNSWHLGQILMVRRTLGLWPPG